MFILLRIKKNCKSSNLHNFAYEPRTEMVNHSFLAYFSCSVYSFCWNRKIIGWNWKLKNIVIFQLQVLAIDLPVSAKWIYWYCRAWKKFLKNDGLTISVRCSYTKLYRFKEFAFFFFYKSGHLPDLKIYNWGESLIHSCEELRSFEDLTDLTIWLPS